MKLIAAIALALSLTSATVTTPSDHRRPEEQTFLTGPEWFLVFSPEEYSNFVQSNPPSRFPFYGHIGQFWQGYYNVTRASARYPTNYGYHLMNTVIGVSTTIEYGLKGLYEIMIGRFSEAVAGKADTAEDRLCARTAAHYVSFIKQNAWFDFDFLTPFKALWLDTGLWGDKPFRKWERKYMLTSEYLAKGAYGWALGKASRATYDDTSERTYAVVDGYAAKMAREGAKLERSSARESLVSLPRYQAFTTAADALAVQGANFHEIAGNRGAILVTVVTSNGKLPQTGGRLIYSQPILTKPGETRYAMAYDVPDLAAALRRYAKASIRVEHIYDY